MSAHNLYNILHLKQKLIEQFYEEGHAWSLMNFFHAWAFDVFVTSECIHLCILCIVTRCLFRDVSIM